MDIFGPLEDKRTIWPFKNPLEEKEDKEDPVTWLYIMFLHPEAGSSRVIKA